MWEEEYDDYDAELDLVDAIEGARYGRRLGEGFIILSRMDINRKYTKATQAVTDRWYAGERAMDTIRSVH